MAVGAREQRAGLQRILVWGAGAIGGTVAAFLRRAGHDVAVVDANASHLDAIRARGLSIVGPIDTFIQPLPAFSPGQVEGIWHTVFLCVKALHTGEAVRQLVPHLASDGVVVSLQNGFNEIVIGEIVGPGRTLGAFINFGADVVEPGVVHFAGRGAVVVGELDGRITPRLDRVHRALCDFEPAAMVTDSIWGYLWGKMGYGALLFATALTEASIVDVLESRAARPALTALAREVISVADAEGVAPLGFNGFDPAAFRGEEAGAIDASFDAMVAFNRRSAKTHTGVWRDIAIHRRKTETDAQFAPVLAAARRRAIPVPHLERLVSLMADVETGVRRQTLDNLRLLASAAPRPARHAHSM